MKTGIIYKHVFPDGSLYIGQTGLSLEQRFQNGRGYRKGTKIGDAITEFGWDSVKTEILYSNIPVNELRRYETLCIDRYNTYLNGLNSDRGQDHVSDETRQAMSEAHRRNVENGTHHFDSEFAQEINRQRIENGTHNFLDSGFQRENALNRIADGTHHFSDSEWQEEHNPFLDSEFREHINEINRQRLEDGTHHFIGDSNPNHRRLADGSHNFLGENHPQKVKSREKKRLEREWIAYLAIAWYLMHDYVMKRRQEFYNKDIPDTSNAEQIEIF